MKSNYKYKKRKWNSSSSNEKKHSSNSYKSNTRNGRRKRTRYSYRKPNKTVDPSKYVSKADKPVEENLYVKNTSFTDLNLHPILLKNISDRQYVQPTKIQNNAIPKILKGDDVLGLANTGSGKTAAFLLPVLSNIMEDNTKKCLIIAPTRELAMQIKNELELFSKNTNIRAVLVVGGVGYGPQIKYLSKEHNFVIATPGRLIDLHKTNRINLESYNIVVLDEVDTMLDMGFIKDIELIISKLSSQKQALFFSATMNNHVEKIANKILNNPTKLEETTVDVSLNVDQSIRKYKFAGEKVALLHDLLESTNYGKFLVFARTRRDTDTLSYELKKRGHRSDSIHGNKSQGQRNRVITKFKQNKIDILVATDVASRGIDIKNITHVINYDEPATYEDYIHRIGRTGRMGKKGTAITFVK